MSKKFQIFNEFWIFLGETSKLWISAMREIGRSLDRGKVHKGWGRQRASPSQEKRRRGSRRFSEIPSRSCPRSLASVSFLSEVT